MQSMQKMKKLQVLVVVLFAVLISSTQVQATSFQRAPLSKLVEESHAAAEVELKEKKSFMNKSGVIMTDYIFNLGEAYNLSDADFEGKSLKITMMGGTVNGVTSFIDGAPEFTVGEKSFLLLKKIESKIYISNFTMGKYKIEEKEGKTYYVSSVFPMDAEMGRVAKERMIDLVKTKFKTTNIDDQKLLAPQETEEKMAEDELKPLFKGRLPADDNDETRESSEGVVVMWGFFLLLLISGSTIWWKLKQGVRE